MTSFLKHAESCVRTFMDTFEQKRYVSVESTPIETVLLRSRLIDEEYKEFTRAPHKTAEELDALCDLLYVTLGTNLAFGITVEDYRSSQVKLVPLLKQTLLDVVIPELQDLNCRFPCPKLQRAYLRKLNNRILDVAKMMDYGFPQAFDAVHAANMGKLWTEEESGDLDLSVYEVTKKEAGFLVRKAGKVIKPPSFLPPDLTPFI